MASPKPYWVSEESLKSEVCVCLCVFPFFFFFFLEDFYLWTQLPSHMHLARLGELLFSSVCSSDIKNVCQIHTHTHTHKHALSQCEAGKMDFIPSSIECAAISTALSWMYTLWAGVSSRDVLWLSNLIMKEVDYEEVAIKPNRSNISIHWGYNIIFDWQFHCALIYNLSF